MQHEQGGVAEVLRRLLYGQPRAPAGALLAEAARALAARDFGAALRLAHEVADDVARPTMARVEARVLLARAERLGGSLKRAAEQVDAALAVAPSDRSALLEHAKIRFWQGELYRSEAELRRLRAEREDAAVLRAHGDVRLWTASLASADECYAHARTLDGTTVVPFRVSPREFAALVRAEWRGLPAEITDTLDGRGYLVKVAPKVTAAAIRAGHKPLAPSTHYGGIATSVIYQRILERLCADEATLRRQIRTTVRHEAGHAVGMSEADLRAVGLDTTEGPAGPARDPAGRP